MADGDCEAETDAMAAISEDDDNPPAAASPVVECDVDIDEDIHLGWTNLVGYLIRTLINDIFNTNARPPTNKQK